MDTIVESSQRQGYGVSCGFLKSALRPSVDRLRNAQFREGSSYSDLRNLLPMPVLGLVWLALIHGTAHSFSALLGQSITVRHLLLALGITAIWDLWLSLSLYTRQSAKSDLLAEVWRIACAALVSGSLPLIANVSRGMGERGALVASFTTFGLLMGSSVLLAGFILGAMLFPLVRRPRVALIVGTGEIAQSLRARLKSHYSKFNIFGCVDDEYRGADADADQYLGSVDNLEHLLKTYPVEVVLIGLPVKSKYDTIQRVIGICETMGVETHYLRDLFKTPHATLEAHPDEPGHFTVLSRVRRDPKHHIKRAFDLAFALLFLLLVSPVMICAALAVRLTSPGPILFVQQRYGRNRKRFPMFKFRSMVVDAEKQQAKLEGQNEAQGPVFKIKSDPRVTKVGAFLRRTSIDELPQLFNVLRGEMSLVGPRPLPLRDVSRFDESWLLRRFSVRPGLTCLWQVNGRSNTSFDYWIKQDLLYIDDWSLVLDFKILARTVPAVLRGSGAH
jgi:exopolysaccharide biosynthesis polyprenyl glycosylphosphotransferase